MTNLPSTGTPQTVFTADFAGNFVLVKTTGAGSLKINGTDEVLFTESVDSAQESATIWLDATDTLTWQGSACELRGFRMGDEF